MHVYLSQQSIDFFLRGDTLSNNFISVEYKYSRYK